MLHGLAKVNREPPLHRLQLFAGWVESNAAFIVLLLLLALAQHFFALVQLVFVATSAASSTLHLQALVATPAEGKRLKLLDVLIIVSVNVWALTLLGMPNAPIWRALLFRAPAVHYSVRLDIIVRFSLGGFACVTCFRRCDFAQAMGR